jgi:citrate lyase subunit beta/citryl-CoA lyase
VNAVRQGFGKREVVVRINGIETEWYEKDLKDIAEARPNAVILPKVSLIHMCASHGHHRFMDM